METDGRADHRLRLRCPAVLTELRVVRQRVQRWARGHGLPDDVLVDLQLAVGEAVSNGIEHAYVRDGTGGGVATGVHAAVEVELELRTSGAQPVVVARVSDQGQWRRPAAGPSYRGRGLALIQRLSRDMQVLRTAQGTQVTFAIPADQGR